VKYCDLAELTRDLKTSKPVYDVRPYGPDGTAISFVLKDKYSPDKTNILDPIASLVATYYDETLDIGRRRFVKRIDTKQVYRAIVGNIKDFYKMHATLKKPQTSLLYKWLDDMDTQYNHPSSEGFIALYRYIHNNGGIKGCTAELISNVFAILELMKGKYEK
jgi:hypothetical protein